MKKVVSMFVAASVSISMLYVSNAAVKAETVYPISSEWDFVFAVQHPDCSYELMNDITLSSSVYEVMGSEAQPFTGTFDGKGHCISKSGSPFGVIGKDGIVKNLLVEGENSPRQYLKEYTGIIAAVNNGTISSCEVQGVCAASDASGGIVGKNTGTVINSVGGTNCKGSVAGINEGTIQNCYAPYSTPLVYDNYSGTLNNCFGNISAGKGAVNGSDNVTLISEDNMKLNSSYPGWDFSATWTTCGDKIMPSPVSIIGKGTQAEPYAVRSSKFLADCGCGEAGKGKYFRIENGFSYTTMVGTDDAPFNGILDGNNVTIYNMLFSVIGSDALVHDMSVQISQSVFDIAGGITGKNYGTIRNCYVNGYISGNKDIGGIAGENVYGIIENCEADIQIYAGASGGGGIVGYNNRGTINNCTASGIVSVQQHGAGGIAGDNSGGVIENCYTDITLENDYEAGGIAGRLYNGTIKNCYSIGEVYKADNVGGIVGCIIEGGDVTDCYFNDNRTKRGIGSEDKEQMGVSDTMLKNKSTFANWDFDNTWFMDGEYPELIKVTGNGTKEHPYIIRNSNDWYEKIPKSYKSTGNRLSYVIADDINNIAAGSANDPFVGSINGSGHSISVSGKWYIGENGYVADCNFEAFEAIAENKGTVEYCTASVKIANVNNGIVRNCTVNSKNGMVQSNIKGGKIINCAVINGPIADVNNNAAIENCYSFDGKYFVRKNDNSATISNCIVSHDYGADKGGFIDENYASVLNSSVIYKGMGEGTQQFLFANRNNGTISDCKVNMTDGMSTAVPMVAIGTGDVKTEKVSAPMMFNYGKANDTSIIKRTEQSSASAAFNDISGHWAEQLIAELAANGIINGYDDGSFRPNNTVTKAEFVKMLLSASNISPNKTATTYIDANQSWAAGYISAAQMIGILDNISVSDMEFGINNAIKRTEASALAGRLVKPEGGKASFTDGDQIPEWARSAVGAAVEKKIITGMEDGTFRPNDNLTRAQAAAIVSRVMDCIYE